MSKIKEIKPKSFTDFVKFIDNYQANNNSPVWYRGCQKSSYKLIPSLYRHKKKKKILELAELEYQLMTRFRQRSIPYHNRNLKDDWEALFFMQHYGVPTRLLDWTENPFIAFYFAVMSSECYYENNKLKFRNASSIWVLNPISWNRHALHHESFDQEVLSTEDEPMKGYKPAPNFSGMNEMPVSLYGAYNSPRIVAQRGVFMIFGQNMSPLEKIYQLKNFPEDCLIKVTLNKALLPIMRKTILNHGITESVVFPDLEGVGKEIRRTFEFEI